jgi:hypothetical protein
MYGKYESSMSQELEEIGKLLASNTILNAVREEVSAVMKDGFVVTDGRHQAGAENFDIVVRCGSESNSSQVARRIRANISNVDVKDLTAGVLGIRNARRGK